MLGNNKPRVNYDVDDDLPFDELDPCCQRELLDRKKAKEMKEKFKEVDPSLNAIKLKDKVLTNMYKRVSCNCCNELNDYPELQKFKETFNPNNYNRNESDMFSKDINYEESNEDLNEDSDSDFSDFDIPLTPYELNKINEMNQLKEQQEYAQLYGLGIHCEITINHLTYFISNSDKLPLVLHIYNPSSKISPIIDYILEKDYSLSYLGTRFRRILYNDNLLMNNNISLELRNKLISLSSSYSSTFESNFIVIFYKKQFYKIFSNLSNTLGNNYYDIKSNMERLLMKSNELSNVLIKNVPSNLSFLHQKEKKKSLKLLKKKEKASNKLTAYYDENGELQYRIDFDANEDDDDEEEEDEDEEDEEEIQRYCDDITCYKNYPHEHVTTTSASFAKSKQQGVEALAHNSLLKF